MKKHLFRVVTASLALVVSVSALSLTAAAAEKVNIGQVLYPYGGSHFNDKAPVYEVHTKDAGSKGNISLSDFDRYISNDGDVYERVTMGSTSSDTSIFYGNSSMGIPPYPVKGTKEEQATWNKAYRYIAVAYVPHSHVLAPNAPWYADANNHWKLCCECQAFIGLNYHHDVDNDGICDECHQPIVYRMLTVKPSEGGKVTLSADKGVVSNRVAVTVTPDPGYKLQSIVGINNNAMHSGRPCFEDVKGSQYHFFIDVWDVEVQAVFVKE